MKIYLSILALLAVAVLPLAAQAAYNDVQFGGGNAIISVGGVSLTVQDADASSVIQSIVVNSSSFDVTLTNNSTFKVTSDARRGFSTNAPALMNKSTTCTAGESSLTLHGMSDAVTVTVTPLDTTCSGASIGGGSGGGGGGGGGSPAAPAAPTAPTGPKTIAELQALVNKLLAQLAALKGGTMPVLPATASPRALTMTLRQGMTHAQVRILQELLAADPAIYPEGKVTGYFGPATRRAVIRFQAKYGITQTGQVGPLTRAKLLELGGGAMMP